MSFGLALALLGAALGACWRDPLRRGFALLLLAGVVLFLALRELPPALPGERWLGDAWNWAGHLLAGAGMLLLAALLVRPGLLTWRACGLTWQQQPGSWWPALAVAAAVLAVNAALMSQSSFRLQSVSTETWLFQATVPGLVEEVAFRGVLLALADRALPATRRVGGAPITLGGLLVTLVFVLLHGLSWHAWLGVLPAALLYLWLRGRTGSLVAPVVAHNLWNLSVYWAHL
jgi:membrane protease YdiL (CAAX protease family)